jgi:hypothetical protein
VTIGGKGMQPPSANAGNNNLRGTMISQAIEAIKGVNFQNVSAGKMAAADWASSKGAVGELAANRVLNDDEKRLLGAQAQIQEAVISAITGAAYNEEQKRNMRAAYVIQATDSPTRKAEKLAAAAQFLSQLDLNSGYTRLPGQQPGGDWQDAGEGYKVRVKP